MPWKRPDSVPTGQVWSRFKGREREGKPAKMYQVRDLDPKYEDQCLELMVETFLRDEPLCRVLGIRSDPTSIKSIRANWEEFIGENISLACFTEEDGQPDELVGFNIIVMRCREDGEESFEHTEGEPWKKLVKILDTAERLVNVFDLYGVDRYLSSSGLTVLPAHRGQNIGARMFAAREPLCKALGVEAVCTVFTATTSQVLAAKCGYKTLAELEYKDMMKFGIDLRDAECVRAKVMGIKFDF
ncbi:uncharacterized protein LOC128681737 [Plodia interpunctella]|uniref:uncharacterized protein LOC128681737 n=1 Tax=Plodia interpunctella TaxID=58824 RepID=UPI0023682903|nr:uncharacterized protein LOC128681737 [Plodia interpunctella]XP_053621845.1 uncharacterized protein LOC128681737 [Plodia interpunctella]